jgi:hypothetical protein
MIEIRQDSDGSLDEIVAPHSCATVHLEDLGENGWSLIIEEYGDYKERVHVTLPAGRAFIYESEHCKIVCSDKQRQGDE